jgi:hypothetical protein
VTRYVEPQTPFHWWPAYQPALPEALSDLAAEEGAAPRPW